MAEQVPDIVMDELLLKKVAALYDQGVSSKQICEQTGLGPYQLKRLLSRDDFKQVLSKLGEQYIADAKKKWTTGCARLIDKSLKVIERNLEDDNLEAVKLVMKSLGLVQEEKRDADTQINVILPGSVDPAAHAIPVQSEVEGG